MMAGERYGLPAAMFAVKCLVAAALALYIALAIGLERPYWSFLTTFIVAQPLAGAVISKAVFRLIGTFAGAVAAVVMVPNLVNAPELLSLAFASWLALCVFIALLDRTPRSYMFVLAGYSACIIGLPSVDMPGDIFNAAALRVQEIGIGILCGSLIHGVVLPRSITGVLIARVAAMVRDGERWSRDALAAEPDPALDAERRRLALDVTELHQLSVHLPFDISRQTPRVRVVRAMQDQLSMVLPLGSAIQDRMQVMGQAHRALSPAAVQLIADTREWLADPGDHRAERTARAQALIARCQAIEPQLDADMAWIDMVRLSLAARLAMLIGVHRDCRDLLDQMASAERAPVSPQVAALIEGRRNRELHRDYAGAARGAAGAFVTLLLACLLWIGSGWADGATAAMLAGVFLSLFAAFENPLIPLKGFMIGTLIATVIGAIYGYAILPRIDGFPMLIAAMAPALLIGGALMASPRYGGIALPAMLGMGNPNLLEASYTSAFAAYVNGAIAQLAGVWFAMIVVGLMQTAGSGGAVRRTMRAGWADIATRATLTTQPDVRAWINRMLDRIAQLAPRLAANRESGERIYDVLRDLHVGAAIGELRQIRRDADEGQTAPLTNVLVGVSSHFRRLDPALPTLPDPELLNGIDRALTQFTHEADRPARRSAVLALVTLRRNLFPGAAPFVAEQAA